MSLQDESHNGDEPTPMERFENLAKRLFKIAKDDVTKAKEEVEEAAEDVVKPTEPEADE